MTTAGSPSLSFDDRLARARAIAQRYADLPSVRALALVGSFLGYLSDGQSDIDLYIFADPTPPRAGRAAIADAFAGPGDPSIHLDHSFWGLSDTWVDRVSGLPVDLLYWSPGWIDEQIDRLLVRHQAAMGYTTCFWYSIHNAVPLFDRDGWLTRLQDRAAMPYPEPLQRAILALNYPPLRTVVSSYRQQIELAIQRCDRISLGHRITALLTSYFDVLFAANEALHPGEKRLIEQAKRLCAHLPAAFESDLDGLLTSLGDPWDQQHTLAHVDSLLDHLDELLAERGLLKGM